LEISNTELAQSKARLAEMETLYHQERSKLEATNAKLATMTKLHQEECANRDHWHNAYMAVHDRRAHEQIKTAAASVTSANEETYLVVLNHAKRVSWWTNLNSPIPTHQTNAMVDLRIYRDLNRPGAARPPISSSSSAINTANADEDDDDDDATSTTTATVSASTAFGFQARLASMTETSTTAAASPARARSSSRRVTFAPATEAIRRYMPY
jgi:hypothetical protein